MKETLPNLLTWIRLFLGLLFPLFPGSWQLGVIIVALLTEFLDGTLARIWKTTSSFGRLFDPIADKIFFVAVILSFAYQGRLQWADLLLISLREQMIILLALFTVFRYGAAKLKGAQPRLIGKATTCVQLGLLLILAWQQDRVAWAVLITALAGAVAALDYLIFYIREAGKIGGKASD